MLGTPRAPTQRGRKPGIVRNVDVTGLIREAGPASFVLTTDGDGTDPSMKFASREIERFHRGSW